LELVDNFAANHILLTAIPRPNWIPLNEKKVGLRNHYSAKVKVVDQASNEEIDPMSLTNGQLIALAFIAYKELKDLDGNKAPGAMTAFVVQDYVYFSSVQAKEAAAYLPYCWAKLATPKRKILPNLPSHAL
jgi:hypothetical protein